MATVRNTDYSLRRGKLNKSDDTIYRVRNGKEQIYAVRNPNTAPPSAAQKSTRSLFGKVNSVVNIIMADPAQVAEWRARMDAYNRSVNVCVPNPPKRYKTVRQFVFATLSEQYKQQPSVRRRIASLPPKLPRGVKRLVKPFAELTPAELYEALKARFNVFYLEQECQYPDLDDIDYTSIHLALLSRGKVIAYCRLFSDTTFHIGRFLTTIRGKGYGRFLMLMALREATRLGATTIIIDAQTHAVAFYEKFGFRVTSGVFIEAGIPHVKMQLDLSPR